MSTALEHMFLDVTVERRVSDHPWQDYVWDAVSVSPSETEEEKGAWVEVGSDDGTVRFRVPGLKVELFRKETEGYRINLAQPDPCVYVVLRPDDEPDSEHDMQVFHVTVCPYEAEHYAESGDEIVSGVPLLETLRVLMESFIATHHVEEPFKKRKRKNYDPRKGDARSAPRVGPRAPVNR